MDLDGAFGVDVTIAPDLEAADETGSDTLLERSMSTSKEIPISPSAVRKILAKPPRCFVVTKRLAKPPGKRESPTHKI